MHRCTGSGCFPDAPAAPRARNFYSIWRICSAAAPDQTVPVTVMVDTPGVTVKVPSGLRVKVAAGTEMPGRVVNRPVSPS